MHMNGQLHATAAFPQEQFPEHPLGTKLGEPQNRLGALEKRKIGCYSWDWNEIWWLSIKIGQE